MNKTIVQPWQLKQRQGLPLEIKIIKTKEVIKTWLSHWHHECYVSFSGGKDSTVLLDLVRQIDPKIPAVFADTGLEYPEIIEFIKTIDNVIWLKPKMTFKSVLETYGYPVISKETSQKLEEIKTTKSEKLKNKRLYGDEKGNGKVSEKWKRLLEADFKISNKCCNVMKKNPFKKFEKESGKKPFVGIMAYESSLRTTSYLQTGCNAFNSKRPMSIPLSFWLEEDIWEYIKTHNLPYADIYNKGYDRTGCMFCMFGVHLEKEPNRFQKMKNTHPVQYKYCMEKLGLREILDYIGVKY